MKHELKDNVLTLYFVGELSSANAPAVSLDIEETLKKAGSYSSLVLNFLELNYISSAGLRVILKLKQGNNNLSIEDASLEVYDTLQMTGFTEIIPTKKALRVVSVEGATVIGSGYFSTVYRINKDTIIKVFNRTSDPDQIQRELLLAKEAFVLGIPTAISFDIVRVEGTKKLGVVFEMLDSESLKDVIASNKDKRDELTKKYADLIKTINTTNCDNPNIPDMKAKYLEKVEIVKPYIEKKYYDKLRKMIGEIEDRNTFIHGDCHIKNIMVQNGELLIIDMDTLSVGHPIFELAGIYAPYCAFDEDDPGNTLKFFGITYEESVKLYNDVINLYFGKDDKVIKDKIALVSYLHMVWWNRVNEPENEVRLKGCRERLYKLLDVYDDVKI